MSFRLVIAAVLIAALAACGGGKKPQIKDPNAAAEELAEKGELYLRQGNYENAITYFERLMARYPFSDYARQAQIDLIYAYYRNEEPESALDAADQFIKENPTHPRVDYAYYMKGLAQFGSGPGLVERVFRADLSGRPPYEARDSFASFSQLLQRFPDSEYADDARQRMIYLRNRLAKFEVGVADYYIRRGAWVAALNRAKFALENYNGAPSIPQALDIMIIAYNELGLPELAADSERVLRENYDPSEQSTSRRFKSGRRQSYQER